MVNHKKHVKVGFMIIQCCIEEKRLGYPRFTTKGALGDTGSLDVDEEDDED